ncbi:MAG: radical SAM protein [bacterium]|nr:radical SAM protein [bacterium]
MTDRSLGSSGSPRHRIRGASLGQRLRVWSNACRNNLEQRRGRTVLKSMPQTVFIDTGNVCNLHCELCPSGQREIRTRGLMAMDVFRPVLETLGPTARSLHLYNWGEPLLNPDIIEMCRIASRYPGKTYIASNLNVLEPGQAEGLVSSGLDVLNVSIDGATQEGYQIYRKGGDLAVVLENLRQIAEVRRRDRASRLHVRWQFLVHRGNQHEIEQARGIAREIGVEFKMSRIRVGLDKFDTKSIAEMARLDDRWLPDQNGMNRYATAKPKSVCSPLWNTVVVNFNGAIGPCCQVFKDSQLFSDGFDGQFDRIWNGPSYVAAREMFVSGEVSAQAAGLVCNACRSLGNVL